MGLKAEERWKSHTEKMQAVQHNKDKEHLGAIALLRELVEDMDTFRRGETSQLVLVDWLEKARRFLDGGDE